VPRVAWLVLALALGGCVSHPVGPARTYGKYKGKAVTTAETALSAVETTRLAADAGRRDNAFGPYLGIVVSEAEESVSGVESTFASIQPPDDEADTVKSNLESILNDAVDAVTEVRVAVRRGQFDRLGEVADPLGDVSDELKAFIKAPLVKPKNSRPSG
jgi:hypothetical protein